MLPFLTISHEFSSQVYMHLNEISEEIRSSVQYVKLCILCKHSNSEFVFNRSSVLDKAIMLGCGCGFGQLSTLFVLIENSLMLLTCIELVCFLCCLFTIVGSSFCSKKAQGINTVFSVDWRNIRKLSI